MKKQYKGLFKNTIRPRDGYFDAGKLRHLNNISLENELLVFYYCDNPFSLGAVLFDKIDMNLVLWRSAIPIWQTSEKVKPLHMAKEKKSLTFSYTVNNLRQTKTFKINSLRQARKKPVRIVLKRTINNPILHPNAENHWEASAVFNSAALYLKNKVHLIYRAITSEGESVLGYASSADGILVDERSREPVYLFNDSKTRKEIATDRLPFPYQSGNSWYGCEDPRLTNINNRIYMTYTAFNNSDPPFMALTSISVANFLKKNWKWQKPLRISPPNEMHKNWVIFPEKIDGKYAILHSLTPSILIEYLDKLDYGKITIKSHYCPDHKNLDWDNWIRGAGPPPIKTKEGWLLLYHAMDRNDPHKYKLGAMLLDLTDPTKILYRATNPILEPDAIYENQGYKGGVVYACGAVVIHKKLMVYYGAADTVLCVASINLDALLRGIKQSQTPTLISFSKRK